MQVFFEQLSEIGKVRSHNEDSTGFQLGTPNGDIYVVCDGMGGHVGGAVASSLAVKSILEHFSREKYSNIIQAIDHAFQFANEQIYIHTQVQPELKGMGTTGVIMVIKDDLCFFGHVGDSRLYLKTKGELHRLTKDHSYVQELVDKKVITDDEAERHPQKNQILRALGHHATVKPDVCELPVKPQNGDVFLICSDGLNGMVNDDVMNGLIEKDNLSISKANLYDAAMANGGNDNISLMLIGIKGSPYEKSEFRSYSSKLVREVVKEQAYDRTQQFSTTETSNWDHSSTAQLQKPTKSNSGRMLLLIFSFLILGGVAAFMFWPVSKETPPPKDGKAYTIEELKRMNLTSLKELAGKNASVVQVLDQQKLIIDGNEVTLTVKDNKLIGIAEATNNDSLVNNAEKPKAEETAPSDEQVKMTEPVNSDPQYNKIDSQALKKDSLTKRPNSPVDNKPKETVIVLPVGVKQTGKDAYSYRVPEEISVKKFYDKLSNDKEIINLGRGKKLCSMRDLIQANAFPYDENHQISQGMSVKFFFK